MSVIGGLDVGGTKIHLRAVDDATGKILVDDIVANGGWAALSDEARAEGLARVVEERLLPLGPDSVVGGIHGCDSTAQRTLLGATLRAMIPTGDVVNDAELVLPATGLNVGSGIIAGTGSCATSRDASGQPFTVGGWGWMLGDEGGATGLVRDAARAVLSAWDDAVEDQLSPLLLSAIGARHPHELGYLLSTVEPVRWANHANVVFAAAARGSAAAAAVIEAHVDALVALLTSVRRRGGDVSAVAVAGGVMRGQPEFFRLFKQRAVEAHRDIRTVVLLDTPPVVGALRLAAALMESEARA
jgi:glucosamine kinase